MAGHKRLVATALEGTGMESKKDLRSSRFRQSLGKIANSITDIMNLGSRGTLRAVCLRDSWVFGLGTRDWLGLGVTEPAREVCSLS